MTTYVKASDPRFVGHRVGICGSRGSVLGFRHDLDFLDIFGMDIPRGANRLFIRRPKRAHGLSEPPMRRRMPAIRLRRRNRRKQRAQRGEQRHDPELTHRRFPKPNLTQAQPKAVPSFVTDQRLSRFARSGDDHVAGVAGTICKPGQASWQR